MVIALLFGAVRLRPGHAAIYGFLLGMIADSLAPTGFGAVALAMTAVGFCASWMKAVFFADHPALNALFLFPTGSARCSTPSSCSAGIGAPQVMC